MNIRLILLLSSILPTAFAATDSFKRLPGIDDVRIHRVAASPARPEFMAVTSPNILYISENGGQSFSKRHVVTGEQIRHIQIVPASSPDLLLTASRHGYRIREDVQRIFTADPAEELQFIIRYGNRLYAATSAGLYFTEENLLRWTSMPGLRGQSVHSLEGFGDNLFIVSDRGLFKYGADGMLRRLFTARGDGGDQRLQPRQVIVDALTPRRLWLATNRGVFVSEDRGESWRRFFIAGADAVSINCIAQPPFEHDLLYLCTDSGFFRVDIAAQTAEMLTDGIPTSVIRWIEFAEPDRMYLATARGLLRNIRGRSLPPEDLHDILRGEPAIQRVQSAALLYNAVDPAKTERWHRRLKYRALFPKVSFDYDKTIGYSVSSSGKYFGVGPYDWGVSLSWDMGNLIWNTYEDDVDNRSRLTTQLRMDILDEINRLYYERLRLKREILRAEQTGEDASIHRLRLAELTATLDGYTGGFYTRALHQGAR